MLASTPDMPVLVWLQAITGGSEEMKFTGCTQKSQLLDRIRSVGAFAKINSVDLMQSQNLEAEMARKVEGWD